MKTARRGAAFQHFEQMDEEVLPDGFLAAVKKGTGNKGTRTPSAPWLHIRANQAGTGNVHTEGNSTSADCGEQEERVWLCSFPVS